MAQDDIQGQVVDGSGNPVSGAIVELTKSYQSNPQDEQVVRRVTTDSNGNYIFEEHPDGDGTTQEWHVAAYNYDGTAYVNSFNNPGVTADLPSNAIPDSAIYWWDPSAFASPWVDEVVSESMTINGGLSSTTFGDGSDAVSGDGNDGHGLAANRDVLYNSMSIEVEISSTTTSAAFILGSNDNTNGITCMIMFNQDGDFNYIDGSMALFLSDETNQFSFSYDGGFNDGNKHKVSFIVNDATTSDASMIVDGSTVTPTVDRADGVNFSGLTLNYDMAYWARNFTGTVKDFYNGKLGKIAFHDTNIQNQTI